MGRARASLEVVGAGRLGEPMAERGWERGGRPALGEPHLCPRESGPDLQSWADIYVGTVQSLRGSSVTQSLRRGGPVPGQRPPHPRQLSAGRGRGGEEGAPAPVQHCGFGPLLVQQTCVPGIDRLLPAPPSSLAVGGALGMMLCPSLQTAELTYSSVFYKWGN